MKAGIEELATRLGSLEEANQQMYYRVIPYWHTALLSLSFLHCKNIALDQVNPPIQRVHNKNAIRRGEKDYQPIPYKILNIRPMQEVLRKEGKSETEGTKKALHITRGHFAHYQEGRALFGKYTGTFWRPQHVRGSKERGVTTKDYTIQI